MLKQLIKSLGVNKPMATSSAMKRSVLNVGGGTSKILIPEHFDDWAKTVLDVNPKADVVCDARKLGDVIANNSFDAIYCSHNLEHYYQHEIPQMLTAFAKALKVDGFAEIRVPDIGAVILNMANKQMDINDEVYSSPSGMITAHDMIYGFGPEIRQTGEDFYAHKTGFTRTSLSASLFANGFPILCFAPELSKMELHVFAFKQQPHTSFLHAIGLA